MAAKLGSGARFSALKAQLAVKKGVQDPGALAAYIGRKKYGKKKMAALGAHGKKVAATMRGDTDKDGY